MFEEKQVSRAVRILKAVAHPLRLRIIARLSDSEENVSGLAEQLSAGQSVVSQQLRILRMSGLVESTRENGFAVYRLAEPHLKDLIRCMHGCCDVEASAG